MKLVSFVFGIRYKNFSIQDNIGSIVDYILNNKNSIFNADFFPRIRASLDERVLIDEEKKNKLVINTENIILEYFIENDFEIDFDKYLNGFQKIIIDEVFEKFEIKKISRFGFVIRSILDNDDKFFQEVLKLIKKDSKELKGVSFSYNLTKKTPFKIKNKYTEDYENEIFSYDRYSDDNEIKFFIDYQKYFNPPIKNIKDSIQTYTIFSKNNFNNFKISYGIEKKSKKN